MAKRKKKIKGEKKLAGCNDCGWNGEVKDIVFNGRSDRSECPNCTGHANLTFDGKAVKKPKAKKATPSTAVVSYDVECLDCFWRGMDAQLNIGTTAPYSDRCPACNSKNIKDYPLGSTPPGNAFSDPLDYGAKSAKLKYPRCYESHPALPLRDGLVIYGGSCSNPMVDDADIYIGFEHGMKYTERSFPWNDGAEFLYAVTDMSVPKKPENYIKLVQWVADELEAGRKVHAGCIGGHGRTGMFFAALVAYMGVSDDAIAYVREHYCHKAVESEKQIKFLAKHFGVAKAKGSKDGLSYKSTPGAGKPWKVWEDDWSTGKIKRN